MNGNSNKINKISYFDIHLNLRQLKYTIRLISYSVLNYLLLYNENDKK